MTILDISNYDEGADMACLLSKEVTGLIVGAQIPTISKALITSAKASNLPTYGTYAFLWDVETPAIRIQKAIAVAVAEGIDRVWLDVEAGNNMPGTVAQRIADVHMGVDMVRAAGLLPGIYCVTPETRILTRDLRWVPAGSLKVGDKLLAFEDETSNKAGIRSKTGTLRAGRRYEEAVVTYSDIAPLPVWEIKFENGESLRCTGEHKWLTRTSTGTTKGVKGARWVRTDELAQSFVDKNRTRPLELLRYVKPWTEGKHTYEEGYVSAAFDGEGCLYGKDGESPRLSFCQKMNQFLLNVENNLNGLNFAFTREGPRLVSPTYSVRINGGWGETLRFLGQIRPPRLLEKWIEYDVNKKFFSSVEKCRIMSIEEIGVQDVARISSSSGTYIAEGFGAHNTGEYFWKDNMGNTAEFSSLPLWHSSYFFNKHIVHYVQYGGWTTCAIHQFSSDRVICGRTRDENFVWDLSIEGEDDMSAADKESLDLLMKAVFGTTAELRRLVDGGFADLEDRISSLETKGDSVSREQIAELRELLNSHVDAQSQAQVGKAPFHATITPD